MFDDLCKHVVVVAGSWKLLDVDSRGLDSPASLIVDDSPIDQILNPEKPVRVVVVLIQAM